MYPSFSIAYYNMFVLITTVNNPDVWMPLYNENRFYFLLFAVYATFVIFIIMNLLLATVFKHYKGMSLCSS